MHEPVIAEFLAVLRGAEFREILAALPGYGNGITGSVFGIDEAFGCGLAEGSGSRTHQGTSDAPYRV